MSAEAEVRSLSEIGRELRMALADKGISEDFRGSITLHYDDGDASQWDYRAVGRIAKGVDQVARGQVA